VIVTQRATHRWQLPLHDLCRVPAVAQAAGLATLPVRLPSTVQDAVLVGGALILSAFAVLVIFVVLRALHGPNTKTATRVLAILLRSRSQVLRSKEPKLKGPKGKKSKSKK
jgi:hypothetical protein